MELNYSDPYNTLSFDKLHALDGGLFGRHIWPLLKKYIEALKAETQVDEQYVIFTMKLGAIFPFNVFINAGIQVLSNASLEWLSSLQCSYESQFH